MMRQIQLKTFQTYVSSHRGESVNDIYTPSLILTKIMYMLLSVLKILLWECMVISLMAFCIHCVIKEFQEGKL